MFFKDLNKIPEIIVIYQIRCVNSKLFSISTNRLGGVDNGGILYIGKATNLRVRMTDFWGAAGQRNPNYSHSGGQTFTRRNYGTHFPVERLQFRYLIQEDGRAAREAEKEEILAYIKRFWELPPLNSQE